MKDTVGPLTDDIGNVILDDGVIAKLLIDYVASIFAEENLQYIPMCDRASHVNALKNDFTDETKHGELSRLRAGKTPGVDGAHAVVFKNHANVISKPLNHIFTQGLICNVVPHDWK